MQNFYSNINFPSATYYATQVHTSPVHVQEAWLLSAAATLKKSLPPTSAKKSPHKSAKKIKELTPRQSGPRSQFSTALTAVNLFTENVESVVAEVVIEEVQVQESVVEIASMVDEIKSVVAEEIVSTVEEVKSVVDEVSPAQEEVESVQEEVEVVAPCGQQENVVESELVTVIPSVTSTDIIVESVVHVPTDESSQVEVEVEVLPVVESADATPLPLTRKRGKNSAVKSTVKKAVSSELSLPTEGLEVIVEVEEVSVAVVEKVVEVENVSVPNATAEQVQLEVQEQVQEIQVAAAVPTPRRTNRLKNSTPSVRAEDVGAKVTRSSMKITAQSGAVHSDICSSEPEIVQENPITAEVVVEVAEVQVEVEVASVAEVPTVPKGRGKRSNLVVSVGEVPSTLKRSRRGQPSDSDDALEIPVTEPSDPIISKEEVSECSAAVVPTPSRSAGRPTRSSKKAVQPVEICEAEEVQVPKKGRGRNAKNVLQAIELEVEEEEEEEALALLCDG